MILRFTPITGVNNKIFLTEFICQIRFGFFLELILEVNYIIVLQKHIILYCAQRILRKNKKIL